MSVALRAFLKHIRDRISADAADAGADVANAAADAGADVAEAVVNQTSALITTPAGDQTATGDPDGEAETDGDAPPPAPVLQSITISPQNPLIFPAQDQQFKATGKFSVGPDKDLTDTVTWSSSKPKLLAITPEGGFAIGRAAGTVTITATDPSTNRSGSTKATVVDERKVPVLGAI